MNTHLLTGVLALSCGLSAGVAIAQTTPTPAEQIATNTLLSPAVKGYFDGVVAGDVDAAVSGFADDIAVNIAGMRFDGTSAVKAFIQRDVIGGVYTVEKVFNDNGEQVVYCLFHPQSWVNPEPPIEYRFTIKNNQIARWLGKYR